jgi:hypothetical protein
MDNDYLEQTTHTVDEIVLQAKEIMKSKSDKEFTDSELFGYGIIHILTNDETFLDNLSDVYGELNKLSSQNADASTYMHTLLDGVMDSVNDAIVSRFMEQAFKDLKNEYGG